jgi:alpha-L-rhamnosidase
VRARYHQRFWNEASGGYGTNNQSCNAISLYMGLVPPECAPRVLANLVHNVTELQGGHLTTGNICTKYLLEALTAAGRGDVAYSIAAQETYPSWGYMLANGATTLWERWELATGSGMNSHNHPMLGSIGSWFYRAIGGIQAEGDAPGFARFAVRPHIDARMEHARAELQTVRGPIGVEWRTGEGRLRLAVTVPVGCEARVYVPAAGGAPLRESGQVIWEAEQPCTPTIGLHAVARLDDLLMCTVGSGEYTFEATLPAGRKA